MGVPGKNTKHETVWEILGFEKWYEIEMSGVGGRGVGGTGEKPSI